MLYLFLSGLSLSLQTLIHLTACFWRFFFSFSHHILTRCKLGASNHIHPSRLSSRSVCDYVSLHSYPLVTQAKWRDSLRTLSNWDSQFPWGSMGSSCFMSLDTGKRSFSFVFSSFASMLPRPTHLSSGTLCIFTLSLIPTIMTRRAWLPLFLCIYNKLLFKATETMIKHSLLEWGQIQQHSPFSKELMVQWPSLRVAVPPVGDSLAAATTWKILLPFWNITSLSMQWSWYNQPYLFRVPYYIIDRV